jgi:hypothetical protein
MVSGHAKKISAGDENNFRLVLPMMWLGETSNHETHEAHENWSETHRHFHLRPGFEVFKQDALFAPQLAGVA